MFNFLLLLYFSSKTFIDFIPNQNKQDNSNIIIKENKDEEFKNKYETLEIIGKGGCGIVYKGKIKTNGELRAIKFINKEEIKNNLRYEYNSNNIKEEFNKFQIKFINEIKIMEICSQNNKNKNSTKFYEYYNTDGNFIIIMELCDRSLQFLLNERKNGFNVGEIRDILKQLKNTFEIMKDKKIIHRDLKLDNILIKNEGNNIIYKLSDYGISKQLGSVSKCYTHAVGTPFTMAPEVLSGEDYNYKCDLWSLGVIIYQLFFKEYPYRGNCDIALYKKIKNDGHKLLKKSGDPKLDNLIRHLLIKDPNKRYTWEQYFNDEFFNN